MEDPDLLEYQAGKEDSVEAAGIAFACMLIVTVIAAILAVV